MVSPLRRRIGRLSHRHRRVRVLSHAQRRIFVGAVRTRAEPCSGAHGHRAHDTHGGRRTVAATGDREADRARAGRAERIRERRNRGVSNADRCTSGGRKLPLVDVEIPAAPDAATAQLWEARSSAQRSRLQRRGRRVRRAREKSRSPTRESARLARAIWWINNGKQTEVQPVIADLAATRRLPPCAGAPASFAELRYCALIVRDRERVREIDERGSRARSPTR